MMKPTHLFIGLAGFILGLCPLFSHANEGGEGFRLGTPYLEPAFGEARVITLHSEDGKTGTIHMDGNRCSITHMGDPGACTRRAYPHEDFELAPIEIEIPGWTLHRITTERGDRLRLAVHVSGLHRLLEVDADGSTLRVVSLESQPRPAEDQEEAADPADPAANDEDADPNAAERAFNLQSGELAEPIGHAHRLNFSGQLGRGGAGRGVLQMDPNVGRQLDAVGRPAGPMTLIGFLDQQVMLEPVNAQGELYELKGVQGVRLRLAVTSAGAYRLLVVDDEGDTVRVVTLETVPPPDAPQPFQPPQRGGRLELR